MIPVSSYTVNGVGYIGPSPNYTCNYNYIAPIRASSVLFELNQEGNPYLNADLGGYVNGSPLRLDPGSNLDWLFFGGPQYSPQMSSFVGVGNSIYVQANFGLASAESPGNYGWNAPGYGFLEVYANNSLIHNYSVFKNASYGPNLTEAGFTFTVQPNTNYYIKAWSLVTYTYDNCIGSNIIDPCVACQSSNL